MNTNKLTPATHVNIHDGEIKAGPARGEPAKIIDYSMDGGKTWKNHGIYCREFIGEVDLKKKLLLEIGPATNRAEMVFPRDCDPGNH